jgi:myo-inositol-1(or 4)-monophosphatase
MRYSPHLNSIMKSIEKATNKISRDFTELENLQTNPASALKFSIACAGRVEEIIEKDLRQFKPNFELHFCKETDPTPKINSEYGCIIVPIDGIDNLSRANPNFTIAVALQHQSKHGTETISLAINHLVANSIYYCEKGLGAFVNNRRLRVSKRTKNQTPAVAIDNVNFLENIRKIDLSGEYSVHSLNCRSLELAMLAAAQYDYYFCSNNNLIIDCFGLMAKEAGATISHKEDLIVISNNN